MKTLDEHNDMQHEFWNLRTQGDRSPRKNGIACPECGSELFDTNPTTQLYSHPPQMDVHCECGFKGRRVA